MKQTIQMEKIMPVRRMITLLIVAVFSAIMLAAPAAHAQQAGNGLQLSPTRTDITASPGEVKSFTITLKNITPGTLSAQAVLNDFESDNATGTPKLIVDNREHTPYSLQRMLTGLTNVEIKPGESKDVKVTLNIPGNAAPGAYFGAIRYSVVPKGASERERQIALNASVAHLVFVEVPGDIVQQIKVDSLNLQNNDKAHKVFFSPPNKAAISIRNLGNGFSRPIGKVTIKDPFGKEIANFDVNNRDPRGIVLPNSARTFTNDVGGVKLPGKYNAIASIAYGDGGEVITYNSTFWYLPVWFIILLLVLIIILAVGGYMIYRKRFAHGRGRAKSGRR